MSRIIGIDLGTTNTCVAVLDERGVPRVVASPEGERTTPSVVAWNERAEVLVGVPARRQAVTNPAGTIYGIKRLIGRKVNADDVSWFARSAPFRIVAAPNGDAWVRVAGDGTSPQEICSHVLARMRAVAEAEVGEPVTRAVVTVPAYFDEAQRQATKDAGTIAGLDVIRILNEPTAAALAYGAHRVKDGRRIIAVFDLGGGTFDISIMAVESGIFEVLATGGDSALGGEDWDRRLIERLADEVFDAHRVDLLSQPMAISRLKEACEAAKKALSADKETWLRLPFLAQDGRGEPINLERRLTRDEVETVTHDLLDRLEAPTVRALADARLAAGDVEEVLLVGGMTRWPAVQALVERLFGRKPSKGANPDEVVAMGAAAYAGILAGEADDAALLDVTPHDIGIKVGDSQFSVIIPRNSMLPVRARKLFATTQPDQKFVSIELYQGESDDVTKNRKLGQVTLDGLPPGPPGSVRVELSLTIDVESILAVTARELKSGQQAAVTIRPSGGLSHREIVEIITRRREEEGNRAVARTPTEHSQVSRVPTSRDLPRLDPELGTVGKGGREED
ncbi:MAG: Hsp70 family protein [Kofleriaceae bacterium]|nr:Hsp70 family protein [Myxococcales bacterium]MCB9559230.1 Hsp70 family protein [Kofleriaceae bacterium]MCB9574879.1 Hsp70 family protein [Kofleriaceae bacterium]